MTNRCDGPACSVLRNGQEAAAIAFRLNNENAVLRAHVREAADLLDVLQCGSIVLEPGGSCDQAKAILARILEVRT